MILHKKGWFCIPFCLQWNAFAFVLQTPTKPSKPTRKRERAYPDSFSLKISWVSKRILFHRKRTQKIEKSNSIDKRMPDFRLMLQWKCHFYCYVLYISPLTPNHTKAHVECDAHSTLGQSPLFQPFNIIYISIWFSNRFPFVQQTKRKTGEREKRIGGNN